MGKKTGQNRRFRETAYLNNATYIQYYDMLTELACVMFEWTGLPETIDQRFLELTLFGKGQAVFFKDEAIGYLALPFADMGRLNVYNIPVQRYATANGYSHMCSDGDSVIIYNNYLRKPSRNMIDLFSRRLYNIDRIMDVNINAQKTPAFIQCSEEQRLTFQNLYMQWDGNMPFIFADKSLRKEDFNVLSLNAPYIADKLRDEKTLIWNEALTYLGISNTNIVKKERLVSDEVVRNQGGTIASRYSRLEARHQACDQINKMFGLNVQCDFREDYRAFEKDLDEVAEFSDEGLGGTDSE